MNRKAGCVARMPQHAERAQGQGPRLKNAKFKGVN